jgi:plasmid maintenance system killer protein
VEVSYSLGFLRSLQSCPTKLQEEALEKITLLSNVQNHKALRVHKLGGSFKSCYAFSVNYHIRILFQYTGKPKRAYLLEIDGHDGYKKK